jgi:ABC-type transport system involved in cytochrome c biogenesis permease component
MVMLSALLVVVAAALRPDPKAAAGVMWTTYAFGAALGFGRAFAWEHDDMTALRLAPIDSAVIFAAKTALNWALLLIVQATSLPLIAALLAPRVWDHLAGLSAPLALGALALAATGTLLGALMRQARVREVLLPVLLLPLALPAVVAAVTATEAILDGAGLGAVGAQLQLLGAFDILALTAGVVLFDAILEE